MWIAHFFFYYLILVIDTHVKMVERSRAYVCENVFSAKAIDRSLTTRTNAEAQWGYDEETWNEIVARGPIVYA